MNILASFERFDKDGIELIIDTATGESFASISGYARMSGLTQQAISKRLKVGNFESIKTAEILTTTGLKTHNLIPESIIVQWLPKDNPTLASQIMQLGVRVFMHKLAGYEVTTTAVNQSIPERQLPPVRDAVDYANAAQTVQGLKDGILKQLIADLLVDELSLDQNLKYLPVAEKSKQYTIAKVRAKSLGYTETQIGSGTKLGRFVKAQIEPAFQEQIGRYPVYHYEINSALDTVIHAFFK
jgi:hypothetical protein